VAPALSGCLVSHVKQNSQFVMILSLSLSLTALPLLSVCLSPPFPGTI
jgi:hypothetical protein